MLVLAIVHVVLVVRDQLAVELAARDGARAAAVAAAPQTAARRAANESVRLRPITVTATMSRDRVTVEVRHRSDPRVPILGAFLSSTELRAEVIMVREPP